MNSSNQFSSTASHAEESTATVAIQQIRSVLLTLWKRRWSAFTFVLIVMTVVSVVVFSQKPAYKATTLLRINKDDLKVLSFQEFVSADESTDELIRTEVEVLQSRKMAERVATVLNLAADADFQKELKPGLVGKIKGTISGSASPIDPGFNEDRLKQAVIGKLLGMVDIEPVRGSRLVKLSIYAHSNKLAAQIANTWADQYIKNSIDDKLDASKMASKMLTKQIAEQKDNLENIEKKLHAYSREHGIYSYDDMKENINQKLTELNTMLTEAESDLIEKQVAYKAIKANPLGSDSITTDPVVQDLQKEVARRQSEYSEMLKTFKPDYPECVSLKARIDQLKNTIAEHNKKYIAVAEAEFAAAQERVTALKGEINDEQQQAMKLQDLAVDYNTLEREFETNKEHYTALLARRKEALSSQQIKASKISVVDTAKIPGSPYSPRTALTLALALVAGVVLACGSVLALEYMDNSVKSADDVEHEIGETLLGVVPEIEEEDDLNFENRDLICHLDGKSTISEAYRAIRTSLAFSSKDSETKNIVISSAVPGEGKTLTAINIATVLGQTGERVLLIDADMRRARLHRSLNVSNSRGLSTYLAGFCNLEDIVKKSCLPNVDIIVAGPTPPNPSELINSDRMDKLMAECGEKYDRVIFDTPPVMAVTDSRLVAAKADGIIHVIRAGTAGKRCVQQAKKQFDSSGVRLIGAVLNDVRTESGNDSHYYYYYNAYTRN